MRKGTKILLVVGCLAAVCALILCGIHGQEPRYQGRSLSYWLHLYVMHSSVRNETEIPFPKTQRAKAAEAVRHIGTNALPLLVARLDYEPSPLKLKVLEILAPLPDRWIPKVLVRDYYQAEEAVEGFDILGQMASPAIPHLASLAADPNHERRANRAAEALGSIGPDSLPALLGIITNAAAPSRYCALRMLATFGTNAAAAVPVLVQTLRDPDGHPAYAAAWALGDLALAPQAVVPALTDCLQSTNPSLIAAAANALGKYGSDALPAIPKLRLASGDTNGYVRQEVTNALAIIAPVAHTNTPAQ